MQESHGKGPASHPDPESCVDGRKAGGEALTGAHTGQAIELRNQGSPGCRRCFRKRKATPRSAPPANAPDLRTPPHSRSDPAQAWKLLAREPGRSHPHPSLGWIAWGKATKPYAQEARGWEVGRSHSDAWEAGGQRREAGEVRGGEGIGQGERATRGHAPDTEPGSACRSWRRGVREAASAASPPSNPRVGAVCGNAARTDLCGGPPARAVPTATADFNSAPVVARIGLIDDASSCLGTHWTAVNKADISQCRKLQEALWNLSQSLPRPVILRVDDERLFRQAVPVQSQAPGQRRMRRTQSGIDVRRAELA